MSKCHLVSNSTRAGVRPLNINSKYSNINFKLIHPPPPPKKREREKNIKILSKYYPRYQRQYLLKSKHSYHSYQNKLRIMRQFVLIWASIASGTQGIKIYKLPPFFPKNIFRNNSQNICGYLSTTVFCVAMIQHFDSLRWNRDIGRMWGDCSCKSCCSCHRLLRLRN